MLSEQLEIYDQLVTVGKRVERIDAHEKVVGGVSYPINYTAPGMLIGKLLRSPYRHAKITNIDVNDAVRLPGVKAILLPQDVPNVKYHSVLFVDPGSPILVRDWLILDSHLRYAGDPVLAVAAVDEQTALEAISKISVDYDVLPAVSTIEDAMGMNSPRIHEHATDNIALRFDMKMGDVQRGFNQSDMIFEGTYSTHRVSTCSLEPHVCIATPDPDGGISVLSSTQQIHGLRRLLATTLEIPLGKIHVNKPRYIGGGFGGKLDMNQIEPIACLLAKKACVPVKISLTREEELLCTSRHPAKMKLKTGVRKDGVFTARQMIAHIDCGAHCSHAQHISRVLGSTFLSQYNTSNALYQAHVIYTNNIVSGGYRGYGAPQAAFAVESQVDEIAEELKIDPLELRLKNAFKLGDVTPKTPFKLASYGLTECVERGRSVSGWSDWKEDVKRSLNEDARATKKYGMGISACPVWVSGTLGSPGVIEHSGAIIKLDEDGSVLLNVATVDVGSGQSTVLAQIAAEALGCRLSDIRFIKTDTDNSLFDSATHASRVTYSVGSAVYHAASMAKKQVLKLASMMLNLPEQNLEAKQGWVISRKTGEKILSFAEIAKMSLSPWAVPTTTGTKYTPLMKGSIVGIASQAPSSNPSPIALQFVKIEVDIETGIVRVLEVTSVHDVGKAINPVGIEGQV
ncbi:MAG: molybdopterin-dependent oxidoreductase, partial [Thaumarchaeota archaeon]|nr:molybdopterin-dependent oxidoreductase [Nitrososphaerota archaeon]